MPYQGQKIQTHPFQHLQGYIGAGKKCYVHLSYQNTPYTKAQIHISQSIPSYPGYLPIDFNRQLSFVATLELPYLTRLTNDPISHSPLWLVIPTKFLSDIPKVNGNPREDPSTHILNYHLWCSSNSLNYDSIHLRLFQCTLTSIG